MADKDELLTVDEAASKLRVNSDTIRRLMRQTKLPGVKIGGQWRISAKVLQDYIQGKTAIEPLSVVRSNKPDKKADAPEENIYGKGVKVLTIETPPDEPPRGARKRAGFRILGRLRMAKKAAPDPKKKLPKGK